MERTTIWLDKTDSTNSEMRRRISSSANLSVIAALQQTAGRGQGDHKWSSAAGENLTFSLLLEFSDLLNVHEAGRINEIITGALTEFLKKEGVEGVWVKEPNDIWVKDRKIAGILIENILEEDRIVTSIVGIGLNLNQTSWPDDLPNPISAKQLTGRNYNIRTVLEQLSKLFEKHYLRVLKDLKNQK